MQNKVHTNSNNSESFSDQNSMDHATMMKITRYKTKYNKPIFLYTEENKFSSESDKSVTRKISHEIKSKENINSKSAIRKSNIYINSRTDISDSIEDQTKKKELTLIKTLLRILVGN